MLGSIPTAPTKRAWTLLHRMEHRARILKPQSESYQERYFAVAWLSRSVVDTSDEPMTYVQLVKEAPGLPEIGAVALRMFCRWGGTLLYNDVNSPAPFGLLQMHI